MNIYIKDITTITTGIYTKTHSKGSVFYLQARDFDKYKTLKTNLEPNITNANSIKKHLLNKGDVLIAAKGFDNFAVMYNKDVSPAVASSIFIVLRNIDNSIIMPEFLVWFLNHPKTQLLLKKNAKGTSLPSINKKHIGEMEIPIPNIKKQKLIMEVGKLNIQEKQLHSKIQRLKETIINQQLINVLNK